MQHGISGACSRGDDEKAAEGNVFKRGGKKIVYAHKAVKMLKISFVQ